MNGDTPVNIAGVLAFPNDADGGMIRFVDSDYHTLFHVPDGGNIILTAFDDQVFSYNAPENPNKFQPRPDRRRDLPHLPVC